MEISSIKLPTQIQSSSNIKEILSEILHQQTLGARLSLLDLGISKEKNTTECLLRLDELPLAYFHANQKNSPDDLAQIRTVRNQLINTRDPPRYFVITNYIRTFLYRTDQGPLRELEIKLWEDHNPLHMSLILDEVIHTVLSANTKPSRIKLFSDRYMEIFRQTANAYQKIINEIMEITTYQKKGHELLLTLGLNPDPENNDSNRKILADQASYVILNKIFSYAVIKVQIEKQFQIFLPPLYEPKKMRSFTTQLQENFHRIVEEFEFAPIFQSDSFFSNIPITEPLEASLYQFIQELEEFNLSELTDDFIGEIYQLLLPLEKKKQLGQVYTPAEIARFMCRIAIRHPDAIVLDPACGCGTFLREIYSRLQLLALNQKNHNNTQLHNQLLSQIWGVEINIFPAQISMMMLAFRDISQLNTAAGILIHDFLDLGPMEKYMVKTKDIRTGAVITREMPHKFDVIIGNPPYIKQEIIPNKTEMMKKLPTFASYRETFESNQESDLILQNPKSKKHIREPKTPQKVDLELTGKTDYYGFFLWYATYLLRDQGTLCFIIPNKWLDVQYGEPLKNFILSQYRIKAIIGFGRNVFENAQVSTCIVLLQREKNKSIRTTHIVKFVNLLTAESRNRVEELLYSPNPNDLIQILTETPYYFQNPSNDIQCTFVPQNQLNPENKWSFKYLYQSGFEKLMETAPTIALENESITQVLGGIKTGANDFYFPNLEAISTFKIEHKYLQPGIKTGRDIPPETVLTKTHDWFLGVEIDTTQKKIYDPGITRYIEDGDKKHHYPDRPSVNWKPWFAIPQEYRDQPDILFLRHIDSDFRARWNKIGAIVADGVRGIKVLNPQHIHFYLGVCNSTFFYWQANILGRWEGQGDLQLLVYELKRFRIPDITRLLPVQITRVEQAMQHLIDRENVIIQENTYQQSKRQVQMKKLKLSIEVRAELDRAVLATLGLEGEYSTLIHETTFLETYRLTKKL